MRSDKIVIVGGGSAGWMTAATLKKCFPFKEITVIESPTHPTVGVGESTLGQINEWFTLLDINEDDWMKFCDASLKLSIRFTDWAGKNTHSFHYPFGNAYLQGTEFNINDWYVKKALHPNTPVTDFVDCFFPAMQLVYQNKITTNSQNSFPEWRYDSDVAYHFDATKFGIWLRDNYCIPKGVNLINDSINENIVVDNNGVEYLTLNSGKKIFADLFIDCTGWKKLLISAVGTSFIKYDHYLPNNKAWATKIPYTNKDKELQPFTDCTALSNGWVWNIPLWSRIGSGYVFSDKFISTDQALLDFKEHLAIKYQPSLIEKLEFKIIDMDIGIHEKIFNKNVCAIGLSAGFIEPLESNGLFTVHEFLNQLIKTLSKQEINELDIDGFNRGCRGGYQSFAEFVGLHYSLSPRNDSAYWVDVTSRKIIQHEIIPGSYLNYGYENFLFERNIKNFYSVNSGGTCFIATGLGSFPITKFDLKRIGFRENFDFSKMNYIFENWSKNIEAWKNAALKCDTLHNFLKKKYNE